MGFDFLFDEIEPTEFELISLALGITVTMLSYVQEIYPKEHRSLGMGVYMAGTGFGAVLGRVDDSVIWLALGIWAFCSIISGGMDSDVYWVTL